jgi:hypothetical protein
VFEGSPHCGKPAGERPGNTATLARGDSNKEIAERLYMSHRTVGSHLCRIFPKLGLRSRVELARLVFEQSASATDVVAS